MENQAAADPIGWSVLAQALNTQGKSQLKTGQAELALASWIQSESLYKKAGNSQGMWGSKINQAQAIRSMGQYQRSRKLLEETLQEIQQEPDPVLKASGLRSLGVTLRLMGEFTKSVKVLEKSLAIKDAKITNNDRAATLLDIANLARDYDAIEEAFDFYKKALRITTNPGLKAKIQLNQLSLMVAQKLADQAIAILPEVKAEIAQIPPSRYYVFTQVNLNQSLMKLVDQNQKNARVINWQERVQDLTKAINVARTINDQIAEAYAINQLSKVYEYQQQDEDAKQLAQIALKIAQLKNSNELIVTTAWQVGHLLKQEGKRQEALANYQEAFQAIQNLRSDLIANNREIQFSFNENAEPIHRQLIDLLLSENASQEDMKLARNVIKFLQLAELDNYFQDTCLRTGPVAVDQIDPTAAVIYPVFLSDRLEVIVSVPHQPLRHYATKLSEIEVDQTLKTLYSSFNYDYSDQERLRYSEIVYNWLVKPVKPDLDRQKIKTIVFVLDGFLRNIPMSALYDGKQYLIENYAVALSSGLYLLSPQTLSKNRLHSLTAGLTESRQGFPSLPGVKLEIKEILSQLDHHSHTLLDQKFTRTGLKSQIEENAFDIIHLATHGQFSSDAEQTFLLTWDGEINVKEFGDLLAFQSRKSPNPLQLLVLSACQTADGDRRAALGIAGIALRSGARSTMATLWSVRDESTAELMINFYHQLTTDASSKAEALRQAQISLIHSKYQHPFFWSPFVLVGNWL